MPGTGEVRPGGAVEDFVAGVADERRRRDAERLIGLIQEVTGLPPAMWGTSIIGFGTRHYRYASGREGDVAAVGFSPRAAHTVLYLNDDLERYADLLERLGPHRTGRACLYITRLDRVDPGALRDIVDRSFRAAADA